MPKIIRPADLPARLGTSYPPPFDTPCLGRDRRALGDAAGLTQYGVNLLRLPPGAWSSQRHWHSHEDEFTYILEGHPTLVTDSGEKQLNPGEAVGFPAGEADGHCLKNLTEEDVLILEVGTRHPLDAADYPDIDMRTSAGKSPPTFIHKNGEPYPEVDMHSKPLGKD